MTVDIRLFDTAIEALNLAGGGPYINADVIDTVIVLDALPPVGSTISVTDENGHEKMLLQVQSLTFITNGDGGPIAVGVRRVNRD